MTIAANGYIIKCIKNTLHLKRVVIMSNELFMDVDEVAKLLGTSKAYAYKLIHRLNAEMEQKGYITISGKVNRIYFNERIYGKDIKSNERL